MLSLGIETDEARRPAGSRCFAALRSSPASIAHVDTVRVINQPQVDAHVRRYTDHTQRCAKTDFSL